MPSNHSVVQQAAEAHEAGRLKDAVNLYHVALLTDPGDWRVHYNLATALRLQGDVDRALVSYANTLRYRPDLADAHNDRGVTLAGIGKIPESIASLRRAIVCSPSLTGAYNALGVVLKEQGRASEAVPAFSRALDCQPGQPDALFARGESLLQIGDWEPGWKGYQYRFAIKYLNFKQRRYPQPLWRGEAGQGRVMLLWSEQGFGDAIQFCRFAPALVLQGWHVVLEVPRELKRLLAPMPGVSVIATGETPPLFDAHFPLLDLPGVLGVTPDKLTGEAYLAADSGTIEFCRQRLAGLPGKKVGIVWRGRDTNVRERLRGTSAAFFSKFLDVPGISVVSLQKDAKPEELDALGVNAIDGGPSLADFADTAALIATLDLVISTDTAVAHLAGAVGVPTWVLLDAGADWRWLEGRSDSPWYRSVRLFRQPKPGDWDSVAAEVKAALAG